MKIHDYFIKTIKRGQSYTFIDSDNEYKLSSIGSKRKLRIVWPDSAISPIIYHALN